MNIKFKLNLNSKRNSKISIFKAHEIVNTSLQNSSDITKEQIEAFQRHFFMMERLIITENILSFSETILMEKMGSRFLLCQKEIFIKIRTTKK